MAVRTVQVNAASGVGEIDNFHPLVINATATGFFTSDDIPMPLVMVSDGWNAATQEGQGGPYDDDISKTHFWSVAANAGVTISNLKSNTVYDFTCYASVFFASGRDGTEFYAIGEQTSTGVQLNPEENTETEAELSGITSNSSGEIQLRTRAYSGSGAGTTYHFLNYFLMTGDFDLDPAILDVDTDNTIVTEQTTIPVNFASGASGITELYITHSKGTSVRQVQRDFTIVSDFQLTFDFDQGVLPFGSATLYASDGTNTYSRGITIGTQTGNSYADLVEPIYNQDPDILSMLDDFTSVTPATGGQIEIRDTSGTISLNTDGTYKSTALSQVGLFQFREWNPTVNNWSNWAQMDATVAVSMSAPNLEIESPDMTIGIGVDAIMTAPNMEIESPDMTVSAGSEIWTVKTDDSGTWTVLN